MQGGDLPRHAGPPDQGPHLTPEAGPQYGFLVTHNEAISIADYYTIGDGDTPEFRPTCHYAYHPCGQAVLSLHEMLGSGVIQPDQKILDENEILWGEDCLGVLLYGHEKNALWYGSRLSIQETRGLAPFQNATGLQVTSAVLAGMAWALRNPQAGIVETDEMDHAFCLAVQRPISGGSRRITRTGRRSRRAGSSSPRRSTRTIPGSSRMSWRRDRRKSAGVDTMRRGGNVS